MQWTLYNPVLTSRMPTTAEEIEGARQSADDPLSLGLAGSIEYVPTAR
jgi:hypothetical protein